MATREIELGFARSGDAHALALMSRDLIEAGLGWNYRAERIARLIADNDNVALVARDTTQPVGFAIMTYGEERAHLVLMAVAPPHQQRGIARRMLGWLIESAFVGGIASIHVELRADNRPAYALYRSMGFAETLRVPGYYRGRETAVRMLRMLRTRNSIMAVWHPPPRETH
jgi:ribosomal-protein-alanine N-acetyltransferase